MSPCAQRRSKRRAQGGERGFTLTELMVAMVGAMFVGFAVFTLAKYSSRFYSREARLPTPPCNRSSASSGCAPTSRGRAS